ncbi:MAG: type II toxin-antitoxin system VapC family toxin [Thermodesulfobacteriota bacterium]|nr:type II toxin-antitoxin system VapC family toxin [Thermodesulfobacteriota bacterium]
MKLLLDTHVILWSAAEPEKLPSKIAEELEKKLNELWFSPISVWEILLLAEKGRVVIKADHEKSIRKMFKKLPFREAVINQEVAIQSRKINLPHQDPADRFLAATAIIYDLTLVTADRRLIDAKGFSVLPVQICS